MANRLRCLALVSVGAVVVQAVVVKCADTLAPGKIDVAIVFFCQHDNFKQPCSHGLQSC